MKKIVSQNNIIFLLVVVLTSLILSFVLLYRSNRDNQQEAPSARVLLKKFNDTLIPLYLQKMSAVGRFVKPTDSKAKEMVAITTLARQWHANSGADVATILEIMGYYDSYVASYLQSAEEEKSARLYKDIEDTDRRIRTFHTKYQFKMIHEDIRLSQGVKIKQDVL